MPAVSTAQRRAIAIAEHHPEDLYARNRGLLNMTGQQMHDFAATSEKGLPRFAGQPRSGRTGFGALSRRKYYGEQ